MVETMRKEKSTAVLIATVALFVCLAFALTFVLVDRLSGAGIPEGIQAVQHFDANRFSGRWYEIARLDHSFERNLKHVTADYSLRKDGGFKVVNSGYDIAKGEWTEVEGRAYFTGANNVGRLRVSFFRPFYGSYVVFYLDNDYRHALVTSSDRSYLWILARKPSLDDETRNSLVAEAQTAGYDVSKLIFP
jgi:apolipoprotein D and lipocalin family protein